MVPTRVLGVALLLCLSLAAGEKADFAGRVIGAVYHHKIQSGINLQIGRRYKGGIINNFKLRAIQPQVGYAQSMHNDAKGLAGFDG